MPRHTHDYQPRHGTAKSSKMTTRACRLFERRRRLAEELLDDGLIFPRRRRPRWSQVQMARQRFQRFHASMTFPAMGTGALLSAADFLQDFPQAMTCQPYEAFQNMRDGFLACMERPPLALPIVGAAMARGDYRSGWARYRAFRHWPTCAKYSSSMMMLMPSFQVFQMTNCHAGSGADWH